MIIFEGDFVQLVQNFHGNDDDWLQVKECEAYDIALLSNGARVPATDAYIRGVRSAKEHKDAQAKWPKGDGSSFGAGLAHQWSETGFKEADASFFWPKINCIYLYKKLYIDTGFRYIYNHWIDKQLTGDKNGKH